MQLSEQRKTEIISQLKEMMFDSTNTIIEKLDKALASGALSEEDKIVTDQGSYAFAKILITLHFDNKPYYPLSHEQKKLLKNLSYFV